MLDTFNCLRCQRVFKRKWDLKRHLSRKTPCKKHGHEENTIPKNGICIPKSGILFQNIPKKNNNKTTTNQENTINNGYKCEYCSRTYKYKYNLNKHDKKCQIRIREEKTKKRTTEEQNLNLMMELVSKLERENSELKDTQKEDFSTVSHTTNNTNCNNTTNHTNNIVNITVNNYGEEDLQLVKCLQHKNLMKKILMSGMTGLYHYIKYKYCNPEAPENFTIKYTNQRSDKLKIRANNQWKTRDKHEVIDELYDRDNNVEEILQVYEKINELESVENLDKSQETFLTEIAPFYNEEAKSEMDKFKSSILTDLYDCHKNNKDKFN